MERELNQERQARATDTQRLQALERELNQERQDRAAEVQALQQQLNQERLLVNQERQARAAEIASLNQQLQGVCEYLLARSSTHPQTLQLHPR